MTPPPSDLIWEKIEIPYIMLWLCRGRDGGGGGVCLLFEASDWSEF